MDEGVEVGSKILSWWVHVKDEIIIKSLELILILWIQLKGMACLLLLRLLFDLNFDVISYFSHPSVIQQI